MAKTRSPRDPSTLGFLPRLTRRAARASSRRPKTVIALWLLMVVGFVAAGAATGTQMTSSSDFGVGESRTAQDRIEAAGLEDPLVENVLIKSGSASTTRRLADELVKRAGPLEGVVAAASPSESSGALADQGRTALVQVTLEGNGDDAATKAGALLQEIESLSELHPAATLQVAGPGSFDREIEKIVTEDLRKAELFSVPITLLILFFAFGALVAASVPLMLGVTSVIAAIGGMGLISQLAPMDEAAISIVVLMGLAVGVDYSLFYIRREREERRRGKGTEAAIDATAATVGRAILISAATVVVALCGLIFTGIGMFIAMAMATILVVTVAAIGSLTVMPAVLTLLGDRVDRGRLPGMRRFIDRREARRRRHEKRGVPYGFWARLAQTVTRRPGASLAVALCLLGTLAVPALEMRTSSSGAGLQEDKPIMQAQRAIAEAFPGAPSPLELVVVGSDLDRPASRQALAELGELAVATAGAGGEPEISLSADRGTAVVQIPIGDPGAAATERTIAALRDLVMTSRPESLRGSEVLIGGGPAIDSDFSRRVSQATPIVVAAVLALALILLLASFRSLPLALAVIGLNLASIAATYGIITFIFQNTWAETLLGFTSMDAIVDWVPIFTFVILFALSMDYTILVLERMREGRNAGLFPAAAAQQGIARTAGAVTSAAVVMVAIFLIFPTLPMLDMKMIGIALAVGVLLDATVVRGLALPAIVTLLGRHGVRPARDSRYRRAASVRWDDQHATQETVTSAERA